MGYKLIIQLILLAAAMVVIFAYAQPELGVIKEKEDELFQYNEAVAKASEFNARLRELIAIRDSFSQSDLDSLEKFVPVSIDQLKTMSEIAGIFSSREITVVSLDANPVVNPVQDVSFESAEILATTINSDLVYQDFEVAFVGSYEEMREVLLITEASDSLLEVVELTFDTTANKIDSDEMTQVSTEGDQLLFNIIFRTYGLPIETNV